MKQNFYFKSLLIALFVLFGGGGVFAQQTQTYFSCNFDNYKDAGNLTSNGWKYSGSVTINGNNPYRYGSSGKGLQLGTTKGASGQATTPALNTSLPSDVQLSFYAVTGGYNNVSLTVTVVDGGKILDSDNNTSESESVTISIANGSSKFYTYNLTGCTSATKIKFYANKICAIDEINVTGDADPRIPVTLEYSADKYRTATESGEITGAPTLTVEPAAAASEVVFSSSNESVAKFDEDGKLIAVAPGTTTITASISGSETYRDAKDEYTLTVGLTSSDLRYNPTSVTVTYGGNFTKPKLSSANGYDGTITYTSSNPSVAEVDENGDVTIHAVGETIITASGAATPYLKASEASFTLTVKDIQGSAVGGGTGGTLFKETFDKTNGTGGWNGSAGQSTIVTDEPDWSFYSNSGGADKCIKQGASGNSKKGYAMTRYIDVEIGKTYTLTFKAAPWNDETTPMKVTVSDGCEISGISSDNMTPKQWNNYTATLTPQTVDKIRIKFEAASENRFFLDEINVVAPASDETVEVTIPASGWGTYCCQWPLDFTAAPEGLKAYAVSATSATNVTLSEITQKLIGGTGIIINGTPGTKYTIKVADKGTAYEGTNMLTGTLAPTYVEKGQYFLKSGKFVYSSAGTLPANKAYLKSDGTGTQDAKLSFVFDTTSIEQMEVEVSDGAWYDLSGRKVNPSSNVKGVYIHNGKKVIVK